TVAPCPTLGWAAGGAAQDGGQVARPRQIGQVRPHGGDGDHRPMEWLANPEIWLSLLTLTALEIVLGIDNLVFIAVLVGKLPKDQQPRARTLGIVMALVPRPLLPLDIAWVIGLTAPLFELFGH